MRNYEDKVSAQLEAGIKVLIYVGTEDWICNWMGNKAWVTSLAWSQRKAFDSAKEQVSKGGSNTDLVWCDLHSSAWLSPYEAAPLHAKCVSGQDWHFDGSVVGTVKSAGPLSFLKVFQAGHMVPMDKPAEALDMITSFTHQQSNRSTSASPKLKPSVLRLEKLRASHLLVQ